MDIDHFKRINDEFGHLFGDEVILMVARTLRSNFRDDDLLFRYGGEEFVVVIGPCEEDLAIKIFDRFRLAVKKNQVGRAKTVTVSIGLAKVSLNDIPVTIVGNADNRYISPKNMDATRLPSTNNCSRWVNWAHRVFKMILSCFKVLIFHAPYSRWVLCSARFFSILLSNAWEGHAVVSRRSHSCECKG